MEKFRNKVIATDYVEKNYIHKDKIRDYIYDLEHILKTFPNDKKKLTDVSYAIACFKELLEVNDEN